MVNYIKQKKPVKKKTKINSLRSRKEKKQIHVL